MSQRPQLIRSHKLEWTAFIAVVILLIAAGVALLVMFSKFQRVQAAGRVTLTNGAKVQVLGAVLGDAPFSVEKPWQKFLRQHLPGPLKHLVPPGIAQSGWSGLDSNSLSVFLLVNAPPPTPFVFPWGSADPVDDDGFFYPSGGAGSTSSRPWSNMVCRLIFQAYPRRQKDFVLRFVDRTGAAIGNLRVPNPSTGPFPLWLPRPFPQTRTNGPVALTLAGLRGTLTGLGANRPDTGGLSYWSEVFPETKLTSADPKWAKAWPDSAHFSDATGNVGRHLSRKEPAWKVRFSVFRDSPSFGPDEKLVITNLAIPAPGTYMTLNQGTNIGPVGIKVRYLAGAGELTLRSNTFVSMKPLPAGLGPNYNGGGGDGGATQWWDSSQEFLLIETTNVQPDERIEVHLHYEGSQETWYGDGQWTSSGNKYRNPYIYNVPVTPPNDAKSFSVTILINRPLSFDFTINPADIQPEWH